MDDCLRFAMAASLRIQLNKSRAHELIEESVRSCRLSRLRLLETEQRLLREQRPFFTFSPGGRLATGTASRRIVSVILMQQDRLFVESCRAGDELQRGTKSRGRPGGQLQLVPGGGRCTQRILLNAQNMDRLWRAPFE